MNYNVKVNGEQTEIRTCKVLESPYNHTSLMEYIMFGLDTEAVLEIESKTEIEEVVIRPLSAGIPFEIRDGKIIIRLGKPAKFSVEINGSYKNNLCVFAHEKKYENIRFGANCMVFSKGIHNTDTVIIEKDGTTVYLEDGAVLNGNIIVRNCRDIRICGYGSICMEKYTYEMRKDFERSLVIENCKNVKISDIIINDSNSWSLRLNGCDNVEIDNLKIFGCRGNSDGIDVCGSRNVTVTDIFTRVWDDSFVVKGFDTGNTENILFKNSVLWNDFARPMEVGVELRADAVRNIRFENIDIIHSTTGYPIMGIHHGDHARVSDIVFKDIRIEDTPGAQLFDLRITNSVWNKDDEMGDIRNITFSDIKYIGSENNPILLSKSRLEGYSEENDIQNVAFHNIIIDNRVAKNAEELGLDVRDHVKNVSVTSDCSLPEAFIVSADISVKKPFVIGDDGMYHGSVMLSLENKNNVTLSGIAYVSVSPKHMERECEVRFSLAGGERSAYEFDMILQPGQYIFYAKGSSIIENCWEYIKLPMIIEKNKPIEKCPQYRFRNYYGMDSFGIKIAADDDGIILLGSSDTDESVDITVFTAIPVPEEEGEVIFTSEEVDFGDVCAFLKSGDTLAPAPQLRCPAEITYVFENEPKIKKLYKNEVHIKNGEPIKLSFEKTGIAESTDSFIMEITAAVKGSEAYRYPYSLFHSVTPESTAHMFGNIIIKG